MKNYVKRILSVALAAALVFSSLTGISWIVNAKTDDVISSTGLEFSTEKTGGTYLQLEKPLSQVPTKVEAKINKVIEPQSWQIISGNENYKNGINDSDTLNCDFVDITNEQVTADQPNSNEIADKNYVQIKVKKGTTASTFSIVKNLSSPIDLSAYDPKDLSVDFWFYTSRVGTAEDKANCMFYNGWVILFNNTNGYVSSGSGAKPGIAKGARTFLPNGGLKVGWNHITVPLSEFTQKFNTHNGEFDYSNIRCLKFNGVTVPDATEENPVTVGFTDFKITVAGSAYLDPAPEENNYTVFSDYSKDNNSPFAFCISENGFPTLFYGNQTFVYKTNVCDGKEKKIGISVETDGAVKFYVDGKLAETAAEKVTSKLGTLSSKHCIGADADGNQCFNGIISDVTVYSGSDVIGKWDLSMSSDNVREKIADESKNSNSAVFVKNSGTVIANIPFSFDKTIIGNGSALKFSSGAVVFEPIDASNADPKRLELKMDVTIENLTNSGNISPLAYCEGQVELTSGGKPDTNERAVNVSALNLRDGTHEYTVSLVSGLTTGGNIDYSAINCMRIYMNGSNSDFNNSIRIKVANVRLVENYSAIPTLFNDGMLFQQNKPMNIFGSGAYGEPVIATLKNKDGSVLETQKTVVSENGSWQLAFSARKGSYDKYKIELTVGAEKRTVNDVVVGELWIAGGQSNMELLVQKDTDAEILIENSDNSNIRVFLEPTYPYGKDAEQPILPESDVPGAYWGYGSNPVDVGKMSAVAYTFAKKLQAKLDVPVGIINSAIGGTVIEGWLSKEAIEGDSAVKSKLEEYKLYYNENNWPEKAGNMSTLYNQKIGPLEGMNIAGVIWYQGESNRKRSEIYDIELDLLKRSWGKAFGYEDGDMPFIFTQVAPYYNPDIKMGSNDLGYLAMYMEKGFKLSENKNTAMLTIYDLPLEHVKNGVSFDPIHPRTKIPVGERFAQSAINMVYGGGKEYTAPVYKSMEVKDGAVYVTFEHTGDGLKVIGNTNDIHGFTIAGSDGVYVNAKAEITGKNTVKVWNDRVEDPANVIYAFDNYNQGANLANSEDIPVSPFRTVSLNDTMSKPDSSIKYFVSQDWMTADKDAWVYDLTYTENGNRSTGYRPSFEVTGGTYLYDSSNKAEGVASLKVSHNGDFTLSPILTYENISKNWSNFKSFSFKINTSASAEVKLAVKSGDNTYYVNAVGGNESVSLTSSENSFKEVTFDLTLLKLNGNTVNDTAAVLSAISSVEIQVKTQGKATYFDEFMFGMNSKADRSEEINDITNAVNSFNEKTVTADNIDTLNSLFEKANKLIKDNNVKEADKAKLTEAKAAIERMLKRISDAEITLKTDNISKVASVDKNSVKLSDKNAITTALNELKAALSGEYSGNYTDSQKASINSSIKRLESALESVEKVEAIIKEAEKLPKADEIKLTDKNTVDAVKSKLDSLSENEKALVDSDISDKINQLYKKTAELYNISHNPKIIEGAGAKWNIKNSESLKFRSNAEFEEFLRVLIDGNELDKKYYKAYSGSTVIEISSDYLKTLSVGEHKLSIVSQNGSADTVFTVVGNNGSEGSPTQNGSAENNESDELSPRTGETQAIRIFTVLALASFSLLLILAKKKQKSN